MLLLLFLLQFLAQAAAEASVGTDVPWYIAAITGPVGLTVFAVWQNQKKEKSIDSKDKEIERLNEERRKDLVSGMLYREQQVDRLLKNDAADRETDQKMVDAVRALAEVLEKTDGTTREVQEAVRDVEKIAIRIEARAQGSSGSSPDLRRSRGGSEGDGT